jgi:5-methylcytosine-specific restriction endonuclease McrA
MAVFERDAWVCQLCGDPVERDATERRLRPSLDHIVAIAHGGSHTWDNVQLAHVGCNCRKGGGTRRQAA